MSLNVTHCTFKQSRKPQFPHIVQYVRGDVQDTDSSRSITNTDAKSITLGGKRWNKSALRGKRVSPWPQSGQWPRRKALSGPVKLLQRATPNSYSTGKYIGGCLPLACQSKNSMAKRMISVNSKTEHSEPQRTGKQTLNLPRLMGLILMNTWKPFLRVSRTHQPAKATYVICRFYYTKDTTWWTI